MQLRVHPSLIAFKESLATNPGKKYEVDLTYITSRGDWYLHSWKGNEECSGGLDTNIGIHFFDLILWLFGTCQKSEVHEYDPLNASGLLELKNANVRWFLSINRENLPDEAKSKAGNTYRSLTCDGDEIEFSGGFGDLHTLLYENILKGEGFGISDARPSIQLVHDIRQSKPTGVSSASHPYRR